MNSPVDPAASAKIKRRRKARNAVALAGALVAGAVGGSQLAPVRDDPLGGWHYASIPVRVCTAQDGAGAARVIIRPEIITTAGVRVSVPEYRVAGSEWFTCHVEAAELAWSTFPAQDVCYTRQSVAIATGHNEHIVMVDIEGRPVGPATAFLPCHLDALRAVVAANPIAAALSP